MAGDDAHRNRQVSQDKRAFMERSHLLEILKQFNGRNISWNLQSQVESWASTLDIDCCIPKNNIGLTGWTHSGSTGPDPLCKAFSVPSSR